MLRSSFCDEDTLRETQRDTGDRFVAHATGYSAGALKGKGGGKGEHGPLCCSVREPPLRYTEEHRARRGSIASLLG
ncbi:unnamed protein product [Boreogadus saida]